MTMERNLSLADLAVTVIGDLNGLLDGVNNDHPQRHLLRQLAAAARQAAHDGLRTAAEIAEATQRLREHLESAPKEPNTKEYVWKAGDWHPMPKSE